MMPLCWSVLLLCLSANAENIALYRESGENVTLECSSAGCPSSIEGYTGMYLYQEFRKLEEVLYYHSLPGSTEKITERERYKNRIQTKGPLKNHAVTISKLTVDDAGFYHCVYVKFLHDEVKCNVYTLVVRGVPCTVVPCTVVPYTVVPCTGVPCTGATCAPVNEENPNQVFIIIAACAISTLVILILIPLILPRVKKWTSSRGTTTVPQVSNDNVYEVMNGLHPTAAPKYSTPSPYDLA